LETNIKLKQLYKNLSGTSGHTKSTDLIIDIIKRIKISGETVPLIKASVKIKCLRHPNLKAQKGVVKNYPGKHNRPKRPFSGGPSVKGPVINNVKEKQANSNSVKSTA
jgi:hypothetical protein